MIDGTFGSFKAELCVCSLMHTLSRQVYENEFMWKKRLNYHRIQSFSHGPSWDNVKEHIFIMPEALTTKEAKCQTAETIPVSIIGQMLNVKIQKCKWRRKKKWDGSIYSINLFFTVVLKLKEKN